MKDGTYYADVGKPDMHGPIAYALYEGKAPFEVRHEKGIHDLAIIISKPLIRFVIRRFRWLKSLAERRDRNHGSQCGK
jgi:1-deoxy-D-xylulose 5-phosphate reductoisomerase